MAQTRAWSSKQLWSHHPSRCSGDIASQSPVGDFSKALWVGPHGAHHDGEVCLCLCVTSAAFVCVNTRCPHWAGELLPSVERPLLDSVAARGHLRLSLVCQSMASWLYQQWVKCHSWFLLGGDCSCNASQRKMNENGWSLMWLETVCWTVSI